MSEVVDPFDKSIIRPNEYVLLRLPSENFRVEKLVPGTPLTLGKFGTFKVDEIIGHPFGFTYEIQSDESVKIVDNQFEIDESLESTKTNQDLVDDPTNQQLTNVEIEELKKAGVTGEELIQQVIKSHGSFNKKTALSQAKYLIRKQKKFLQRFTPEPIGTNELISIYTDRESYRIMNMAPADLGLMMTYANVKQGGVYIVVDDIKGLLVAGLLERLAGKGTVILIHGNEEFNIGAVAYMNYPEDVVESMVKPINWLDILHPEEALQHVELSTEDLDALKPAQKKNYYKRKQRVETRKEIEKLLAERRPEGLLVASELYLPTMVPKLLDFLQGSASIALYSDAKEILVSTNEVLLKDLRVVGPSITESRVRHYQTVPGRIHPHMTSKALGGFILSGTRVIPGEGVNAAGKHGGKKKRKTEVKGGEKEENSSETADENADHHL